MSDTPRRKLSDAGASASQSAPFPPWTVLLFCLTVMGCGTLSQENSGVQFRPEQPQPGERVEVTYRPIQELTDANRVRLRARFRTPSDDAYNDDQVHSVVDTLTASHPGVFRGSFVLPDSVVYGAFAVESLSGEVVDSNDRKLWELSVHGPGGPPLLAALEQRQKDLMGRNWKLAYTTARRATELYPDSVAVWSRLEFYQSALLGEAAADSIRTFHREKFRMFDERYRTRDQPSGELAGVMMWYASDVGDSQAAGRWRERFLTSSPGHPLAVQERANRLFRAHHDRYGSGERPAVLLAEFEALWQEVGSAHPNLLLWAWRTARRMGDPEKIRLWGDRRIEADSSLAGYVARAYVDVPELRARGIQLLNRHVERLRSLTDTDRLLHQTVTEARAATRDERAMAQVRLAEALLESGDRSVARRHVAGATKDVWDTSVFRRAADLRVQLGDTLDAAKLWARVAADPNSSEAFEDSVRARVGGSVADSSWEAWRREAQTIMRKTVVQTGVRKPLSDSARLLASEGDTTRLVSLLSKQPSVVVFWSRYCGPSLRQLPSLQQFYENLPADPSVRVVAITDEPPSDGLRTFLEEKGFTVPVYHDLWGETGQAFNQWGTPQLFVVDGAGRVRFEYTQLSKVPRQIQAIKGPPVRQRSDR